MIKYFLSIHTVSILRYKHKHFNIYLFKLNSTHNKHGFLYVTAAIYIHKTSCNNKKLTSLETEIFLWLQYNNM